MKISSRFEPRRTGGSTERGDSRGTPLLPQEKTKAQVVSVDDELELGTIAEIERFASAAATHSSGRLVIDLTAVEFLTNGELALLAGMLRRVLRNGASVTLAGCDPRARGVLTELRSNGLVFAPTVRSAFEANDPAPSLHGASSARSTYARALARIRGLYPRDRSHDRGIRA